MNSQGDATAASDITVLGGGLAGLCLAIALPAVCCRTRGSGSWRKTPTRVPEAAFKVGESTVEVGANYFAKVLGLEQHIREQQLPKLGLRFFFPGGDNTAIERRLELGGTRFRARAELSAGSRSLRELPGPAVALRGDIEFVDGARVREINLQRGSAPHQVRYERDGREQLIKTRWVVDASGRAGLLKRQLGLDIPAGHQANATWFRVKARIKIDDWSRRSALAGGLRRNHGSLVQHKPLDGSPATGSG